MKKIEGNFDDGARRTKLTLVLICVGFFSIIIGVLPFDAMIVFIIIGILLFVASIIILFLPGMYKTVLSMNVSESCCTLHIDYSGTKHDLKNPFKYDACVLPVMQNQYQSMMYFKIVFYDSAGIKHSFYEKIENEISEMKGIKILSNTEKWLLGINENIKPFPSTLWQIYQELEKHPECKNIGKRKASEIDSPFEE